MNDNTYEVKSIGTLEKEEKRLVLMLNKEYAKGTKFLEDFSHIHVFYRQELEQNAYLNSEIFKINSVEKRGMEIILEEKEFKAGKAKVFDIKPYFPCEDSVRESRISTYDNAAIETMLKENKDDPSHYSIKEIGTVYDEQGEKYVQLSDNYKMEYLTSCSHVILIWWFHKFDKKMYRNCLLCDPPYENAKKTGVFASRSPVRPNPIAMTVSRIVRLENQKVYLTNLECFDGTPCIALIPYDRKKHLVEEVKVPEWLSHWPKWLDDRNNLPETSLPDIIESPIEELLTESEFNPDEVSNHGGNIDTAASVQKAGSIQENESKQSVDSITVWGARENNLKNFHCSIPYHKITAVVGVSGSGKSSLVHDTIYAECQRRMECLTNSSHLLEKPNMDYMTGSIPAVLIAQRDIGRNSRSMVGTYSNAYDYLRNIYAAIGIRHCVECGNPIIPMTADQIFSILEQQDAVEIYDIDKNRIRNGNLEEQIRTALKTSQGALYAKINQKFVLMQTTQKCYICDHLYFELTSAAFAPFDLESMCPVCHGYGEVTDVNTNALIEYPNRSLLDGASLLLGKLRSFQDNPNANWMKGSIFGLANSLKADLELPYNKLPEDFKRQLIYGSEHEVTFEYHNKKNGRDGKITRKAEGIYPALKRLYSENSATESILKYMTKKECSCCHGERLKAEGRLVSIQSLRYPQAAKLTFSEIRTWCEQLQSTCTKSQLNQIRIQAESLQQIADYAIQLGIGHLTLDRSTTTLSGGEAQRLKFLSCMQNQLSGILYVLDEPSKGLHPKDYEKLQKMIHSLIQNGNTVLMVEHNEDMIRIADHIIELGPKAGSEGGYLVGQGSLEAMLHHKGTQICEYMSKDTQTDAEEMAEQTAKLKDTESHQNAVSNRLSKQKTQDFLKIHGARFRYLKNIDVSIPLNAITCICGVSGSGKSSLMRSVIYEEMKRIILKKQSLGKEEDAESIVENLTTCTSIENADKFSKVVLVEQGSIGRTTRSVPATYIGIMDTIRSLFANTQEAIAAQLNESAFSFNQPTGQCEHCHGEGSITPEFTDSFTLTCPICKGKRYKKKILQIQYQGKTIDDVLNMSIADACDFFKDCREITEKLSLLNEVGLSYLKLGQSISTLSGGEASRLKLAAELMTKSKGSTLYLMDEPTVGLHFSDIEHLLALFDRLIAEGNTIVVIEHNKQMRKHSDWVIELGPGAGTEGGYIISNTR